MVKLFLVSPNLCFQLKPLLSQGMTENLGKAVGNGCARSLLWWGRGAGRSCACTRGFPCFLPQPSPSVSCPWPHLSAPCTRALCLPLLKPEAAPILLTLVGGWCSDRSQQPGPASPLLPVAGGTKQTEGDHKHHLYRPMNTSVLSLAAPQCPVSISCQVIAVCVQGV